MIERDTYSFYIDRLYKWLETCGLDVNLFACEPPDNVGGTYNNENSKVKINESDAKMALKTLAHEAGHWLGYRMFGEKKHSYQRERQAFVYGWRILNLIGAVPHKITREEWIKLGW